MRFRRYGLILIALHSFGFSFQHKQVECAPRRPRGYGRTSALLRPIWRRCMSINLAIANPISETQQPIQDQDNNNSALYISQSSTNMPDTARLVFGVSTSGTGEFIQNTNSVAQTTGISLFVNNTDQHRLTYPNA